MKVSLVLRRDKPYADAGWGVSFLRWNWRKPTRLTLDSRFQDKKKLVFYIKGEQGGEQIGVSLKSDRGPFAIAHAHSDEEKVPLAALGKEVSNEWRQMLIPMDRFYNVDHKQLRNLAFYTDVTLAETDQDRLTIYIKKITFR